MNQNEADNLFTLGVTYLEQRHGSKLQNINNAIEAFQEATKYYAMLEYPYHWGLLQANLGHAFYIRADLIPEKQSDLKAAIDHVRRSQLVINRESYPFEWAENQNILAGAFGALDGGEQNENLETAIQLYKESLEYFSRNMTKYSLNWAHVNNNLGSLFLERRLSDEHEDMLNAIHYFKQALSVYLSGDRPEFMAILQTNLGRAFATLYLETREEKNYLDASQCFQNSLRIWSPELHANAYRRSSAYLAKLYFAHQQWQDAFVWFEKAIQTGRGLLLNSYSDEVRRVEVNQTADNYANAAFCLLKLGRYMEALQFLEKGKARMLTRALVLNDDLLNNMGAVQYRKIKAIREKIKSLEDEFDARWKNSPDMGIGIQGSKLEIELRDANLALEDAMDELPLGLDEFSSNHIPWNEIDDVVPEHGALVSIFSTVNGTAALIVPNGAREIGSRHVVFIENFTQKDLSTLLWGDKKVGEQGWIRAYQDAKKKNAPSRFWGVKIESVTKLLWEKLVSPIESRLQEFGVTRIIFMLQSGFQLLPLHAAWTTEEKDGRKQKAYLLDKFNISYVSSIFILRNAIRKSRERIGTAALIAGVNLAYDRLSPLPNAVDEVNAVASLFETKPLIDFEATAYKVQQRAASANYIHLACHGAYAWGRAALDSSIFLASDKQVPLSKIISDYKLENARLVTLSACETGISDISNASPDEYVGFPTGFMQAGAAGVVSSLWNVDDQSTKLLMEKFYELHLHRSLEPSEALRVAQMWLRDLDAEQIISPKPTSGSRSDSEGYDEAISKIFAESGKHPYSNPYYWAAFTHTGA